MERNGSSISAEELGGFLNMMLEAERAGARTLAAFMDEYPRDSEAWKQLQKLQRDEAENCTLLIRFIKELGVAPSTVTGDFLGKALAVQGRVPRLSFLNRGQGWVARQIAEILPRVEDASVKKMLSEMHDSHIANIEACNRLLLTIDDQPNR
jgi:nitronate monooxygenase